MLISSFEGPELVGVDKPRKTDGLEKLADSFAVGAYVTYAFCSMFSFLTIGLKELPIFGSFLAENYIQLTVVFAILAIMLRDRKESKIGAGMLAAAICLLVISRKLSGVQNLLICVLILMAVRASSSIKLVKFLIWISLCVLIICFIYIKVLGYPECWDKLDGSYVSGLGTIHPNAYSILIFNSILSICFVSDRERHFLLLMICVLVGAFFAYFIQHSDTTLIAFIILIAALITERFFPRIVEFVTRPNFFFVSLTALACLIALGMLAAAAYYSPDNDMLVSIDRLLHARIRLPNAVVREYGGYPLFGAELKTWTGSIHGARMKGIPMMMLDSSYVRYALTAGMLVLACMMVIFIRAMRRLSFCSPQFLLWAAILIMIAYFVMEYYPSNLCFNCTIPFLAYGLEPSQSADRWHGIQGKQ